MKQRKIATLDDIAFLEASVRDSAARAIEQLAAVVRLSDPLAALAEIKFNLWVL